MNTATPTERPDQAAVMRGDGCVVIRLRGTLDVHCAGSIRRLVQKQFATTPVSDRIVVDLADLEHLDGAGLNAVTAPSFTAARRGANVTVLPPTRGAARRFSDTVGILPIGAN